MDIGVDSGTVAVLIGLGAFGAAYNAAVGWLQRHGYEEGYNSLLVVAGVAATLLGVAIVNLNAAALCLAAFCVTGLPMVAGSVWRHARRRERAQDAIRREVLR